MYQHTTEDLEYQSRRNALIPFAEGTADRAVRGSGKKDAEKWNRAFHKEMTRRCVAEGLIRPENLDLNR